MEIKDLYWKNDRMRVGWVSTFMLQGGKLRDQVRLPKNSAGEVWKERKEPTSRYYIAMLGQPKKDPKSERVVTTKNAHRES